MQKKPEQNTLRRQFCSDNRSLLVKLCPSASPCSSPGLSALRAGFGAQNERTSGESFSARRWQGDHPKGHPSLRAGPRRSNPPRRACAGCEPGPSSSTTAHRGLHLAHSSPPTWECRVRGARGTRSAGQGSKGQRCPPPRKIPAAWCNAELWGQAWIWGIKGHPDHRRPKPGDTHHTEP